MYYTNYYILYHNVTYWRDPSAGLDPQSPRTGRAEILHTLQRNASSVIWGFGYNFTNDNFNKYLICVILFKPQKQPTTTKSWQRGEIQWLLEMLVGEFVVKSRMKYCIRTPSIRIPTHVAHCYLELQHSMNCARQAATSRATPLLLTLGCDRLHVPCDFARRVRGPDAFHVFGSM